MNHALEILVMMRAGLPGSRPDPLNRYCIIEALIAAENIVGLAGDKPYTSPAYPYLLDAINAVAPEKVWYVSWWANAPDRAMNEIGAVIDDAIDRAYASRGTFSNRIGRLFDKFTGARF